MGHPARTRSLSFLVSAALLAALSSCVPGCAPQPAGGSVGSPWSAPSASASGAGASSAAPAASEAEPEQVPDIEYVPTPQNVVDKLLDVAKVGKDDVLYDLGCGDGRIVINAAKRFAINPNLGQAQVSRATDPVSVAA